MGKFKQYLENTNESDLDIANYIQTDGFNLVADFEGLSKFLYSDKPQKEIGDFILASNLTKDYLEQHRIHSKNESLDAYEIYKSFANKDYVVGKNEFNQLYKYIININLDKKEFSISQKIVDAICLLRNNGVSDDLIREAIFKLCNYQSVSLRDLWPNIDEFLLNNEDDYINTQRKFLKSISTKFYDIVDIFAYLNLDENYNDVTIENRFLYPRIINEANNLSNDLPVLIINPSLSFVKKWFFSRYPFKNKKTLIILNDKELAELLNSKLPQLSKTRFGSFDMLDDTSFDSPSLSVIFANNFNDTLKINNIIENLNNKVVDVHKLLLFIPDGVFNNDKKMIDIVSKMDIFQIDLLPSGIANSTSPQRKSLFHINYGYKDYEDNICVQSYKLYKERSDILAGKAFSLTIKKDDYYSNTGSLRSLYFKENRTNDLKTNTKRQKAKIHHFSNEISIEYSESGEGTKANPRRIQAHVLFPNSNNRIVSCKGSTKLLKDENIEDWINKTFVYSIRKIKNKTIDIREEISKIYLPFYSGKSLSLKTFLYIHKELSKQLPEYADSVFVYLNKSYFADLPVNKLNEETLKSFISSSFDLNICTEKQFLSIMAEIINVAIENGNAITNPARTLLKEYKNDDWGLASVKSALTQKFFYLNQIKKIENISLGLIDSKKDIGLGVAVLIRLYLGLESNIVSSLKWKDFKNETIPYLIIQRQTTNDGSSFLPFAVNGQVRKMPTVKFLYDVLKSERQRQLNEIANGDEDYLDECTIVFGTNNVINGQSNIYSPFRMNTNIRKMIKRVGLDPLVIEVPTIKNGTVEINLSYYSGDIFKYNYWHYLVKEHPDIRSGELYYLCGNKIPEDTLSNHYIDYGNNFSTERLYSLQPTYMEHEQ